uniref:Uncharacterized protein n=1 Tax=Anguilla anguilla TaxID=7936 RepID=A0A0E9U303_ANGAN
MPSAVHERKTNAEICRFLVSSLKIKIQNKCLGTAHVYLII